MFLAFSQNMVEILSTYLPTLLGLTLRFNGILSCNFLSAFKNLEQLSLYYIKHNGLINDICKMNNGLKILKLSNCAFQIQDLSCLAKSKHSQTLQQLELSFIDINNTSSAVGIITLCQNMTNVKVIILNGCQLEHLSSHTISSLVKAFTDCHSLAILDLRYNLFSVPTTALIVDGLAQLQSLRYLGLNYPYTRQSNLYKIFHEAINKIRHSPLFISWYNS